MCVCVHVCMTPTLVFLDVFSLSAAIRMLSFAFALFVFTLCPENGLATDEMVNRRCQVCLDVVIRVLICTIRLTGE